MDSWELDRITVPLGSKGRGLKKVRIRSKVGVKYSDFLSAKCLQIFSPSSFSSFSVVFQDVREKEKTCLASARLLRTFGSDFV